MTDAARDLLARALHETARKNHNLGEGLQRAICQSVTSHDNRADAILATPEGQRISEAVALLEAVERLPHRDHGWLISRAPDESLDAEEGRVFEVRLYDQPKSHYRRTITDAVAAAIGDKP